MRSPLMERLRNECSENLLNPIGMDFHQVIVKRTVTFRRDAANTLVRHGGAEAASPHGVKQENDYKLEVYNV